MGIDIFYKRLWNDLGIARKMVLSTSYDDNVTSRMVSVVIIDEKFYFQTDKLFRKYEQLIKNPKIALCIDNFQVEAICEEIGSPMGNEMFCKIYEEKFSGSFEKYTHLSNERLFICQPTFIKKWIYENGVPFQEIYDFKNNEFKKEEYIGV